MFPGCFSCPHDAPTLLGWKPSQFFFSLQLQWKDEWFTLKTPIKIKQIPSNAFEFATVSSDSQVYPLYLQSLLYDSKPWKPGGLTHGLEDKWLVQQDMGLR